MSKTLNVWVCWKLGQKADANSNLFRLPRQIHETNVKVERLHYEPRSSVLKNHGPSETLHAVEKRLNIIAISQWLFFVKELLKNAHILNAFGRTSCTLKQISNYLLPCIFLWQVVSWNTCISVWNAFGRRCCGHIVEIRLKEAQAM